MYCGECGAQNKNDDIFCSECGAKLEKQKIEKTPKKLMNKKTKILIIVFIFVILTLGILFKIGSTLNSPKNVAKNYIEALMNNDTDKLYNYIEVEGDSTFISKELFKETTKQKNNNSKIQNYVITDIKYTDSKLKAVVTFSYTLKNSSNEKRDTVTLTKSKNKKLLFFDDWKIQDLATSELILENYEIKVPKNSKIIYGDVKVKAKYLNTEKSTNTLDVYILPQVFISKTKIKVQLPNGLEIIDDITPSKYYSIYKLNFDKDLLTENQKKSVTDNTKTLINSIYNGIVNGLECKDLDLNVEDLQKIYNDIISDLKSSEITLTKFEISDVTLSSMKLDDDNDLEVKLRVKYNYSLKYKSFNDEEKIKDGSSSDYVIIKFEYKDGLFNVKNIDELDLYFSKYF